jgi:hypothetical protein
MIKNYQIKDRNNQNSEAMSLILPTLCKKTLEKCQLLFNNKNTNQAIVYQIEFHKNKKIFKIIKIMNY